MKLLTALCLFLATASAYVSDCDEDDFTGLSIGEARSHDSEAINGFLEDLNIETEIKTVDDYKDFCLKVKLLLNHKVCFGVKRIEGNNGTSNYLGFRLRYKKCTFWVGRIKMKNKFSRCLSFLGYNICFKDFNWKHTENGSDGQREIKVDATFLYKGRGEKAKGKKVLIGAIFRGGKIRDPKFKSSKFDEEDEKMIVPKKKKGKKAK